MHDIVLFVNGGLIINTISFFTTENFIENYCFD